MCLCSYYNRNEVQVVLKAKKKSVCFRYPDRVKKIPPTQRNFIQIFPPKKKFWVIIGSAMVPARQNKMAARGTAPRRRSITIFYMGNRHIFGKRSESWRLNGERSFSTLFLWKKGRVLIGHAFERLAPSSQRSTSSSGVTTGPRKNKISK